MQAIADGSGAAYYYLVIYFSATPHPNTPTSRLYTRPSPLSLNPLLELLDAPIRADAQEMQDPENLRQIIRRTHRHQAL